MSRILVVENNDAMREFLAIALGRVGHDVVLVEDGDFAVQNIEMKHFDLLLTDVCLPGIDGIELVRITLARLPEFPVIIITSYPAEALNARDLIERNVQIFSKPFNLQKLVCQVTQMLSVRPAIS